MEFRRVLFRSVAEAGLKSCHRTFRPGIGSSAAPVPRVRVRARLRRRVRTLDPLRYAVTGSHAQRFLATTRNFPDSMLGDAPPDSPVLLRFLLRMTANRVQALLRLRSLGCHGRKT